MHLSKKKKQNKTFSVVDKEGCLLDYNYKVHQKPHILSISTNQGFTFYLIEIPFNSQYTTDF